MCVWSNSILLRCALSYGRHHEFRRNTKRQHTELIAVSTITGHLACRHHRSLGGLDCSGRTAATEQSLPAGGSGAQPAMPRLEGHALCTVRVFRQKSTLEYAIGSHTCSLEALACMRPMTFLSGVCSSYRLALYIPSKH